VSREPFPEYDPELAADSVVQIAVQVNGKLRGTFSVPAGTGKETIIELARGVESVEKFLEGKTIVREIVVPGKLVNFAVQ
jgi:leucyl-tRNA synthetase